MIRLVHRRKINGKLFQRAVGVWLVFLILSDIGFHIAEPFFEPPENPAGALFLAGHLNPDSPGGCGIPDHFGNPFHHHHYPGVISQTPPPVPLITMARVIRITSVEAVLSTSVIPIGRAPPIS